MRELIAPIFVLISSTAIAESPVIEAVRATQAADGWRFDVTLSHPDTGWDHYADGWRVVDMDGSELGTRVLFHPHETEQPFTRSLAGVAIPDGATQVRIESRCIVDGWSSDSFLVDLP